jgi:hypothetical protein
MPRLVVTNTQAIDIPDLAVRRPLRELSEKRITKAVREALRKQYGLENVTVSCSATLSQGQIWTGKCRIEEKEYSYRLMRGLYD